MQDGNSMRNEPGRKDGKTQRRNVGDRQLSLASLRHCVLASCLLGALSFAPTLHAQITVNEYAARRDSLAGRIGSGVVIAFGGRTPVSDFGPFYQLPAFRYLTGYEFADAALVMVVRGGRGTSTLFVTRSTPRRALYYGEEPDSAAIARQLGLASRPASDLAAAADSLASAGLPPFGLRGGGGAPLAARDRSPRRPPPSPPWATSKAPTPPRPTPSPAAGSFSGRSPPATRTLRCRTPLRRSTCFEPGRATRRSRRPRRPPS